MRGCDVTIGSRPGCVVVASMKSSCVATGWCSEEVPLRIYRTDLEGLAGMLLIECFFFLN